MSYMHRSRRDEQSVWVNHKQWTCRRHCPAARYPAAAEKCLMGCAHILRPPMESRPADPDAPVVSPAPKAVPSVMVVPPGSEPWRAFNTLGNDRLPSQSLNDLRKYAANVLNITGASKIRGGKPALVDRIRQHRMVG